MEFNLFIQLYFMHKYWLINFLFTWVSLAQLNPVMLPKFHIHVQIYI